MTQFQIFSRLSKQSLFFLKSPAQADPEKFFLFVRMGSQNMRDKRKEDSVFVSEIYADQAGIIVYAFHAANFLKAPQQT